MRGGLEKIETRVYRLSNGELLKVELSPFFVDSGVIQYAGSDGVRYTQAELKRLERVA